MRLAIVGYGKMGHMIAAAAALRGHDVVCTVDPFAKDASIVTSEPLSMATAVAGSGADAVIEFSHPSSVRGNIDALIPTGLPLVVGTTGWHDSLPEVSETVKARGSALFYSSNFSVGVNLFYRIVSDAARLLADFENYDVAVFESHHSNKADSPSGTGIEIARRILENVPRKTKIVSDAFTRKPDPSELHLASLRVGSTPGTHSVFFDSAADTIELTHVARNREGFALGAVRAAEWLIGAGPGIFTMNDIFDSL